MKQLFTEGRLKVTRPLKYRVTFHDPCHLGRFNKGYEAPRELLALLGCELVEMGRCRANSFCCGAGGGRIWIPRSRGIGKTAQNRMKEAALIPGLRGLCGELPEGSHHVRGRTQNDRQRGQIRGQGTDELIREAIPAPVTAGVAA